MPSGRFKIYRLPVVCGDSLTGKTTTFTGLYGFLAPFWVLKNNILRRFERDGHRLLDAGIRLDTDRRLTIPLTIKISPSSSVELASVDWVVETMTSLFESVTPENLTFHLARKDKILAHHLVERCMKFLGIKGINIVDEIMPTRHKHPVLRLLQKNIDFLTERFRDYANQHKYFDDTNVSNTLKGYYTSPPEIDDALLERLISFAMERNFRAYE